MNDSVRMTKGERDELLRIVKQRERVAKSAAEQRSAVLMAEFEEQVSTNHPFNKDEVWKALYEDVDTYIEELNAKVTARCESLGIPEEFRPRLHLHWASRGENMFKDRVIELRRVAKAEIEAMEKSARVQIEHASLAAQTEIVQNGLISDAAKAFLERLPTVETLMPTLEFKTLQKRLEEKRASTRYLQ